MLVDQVGRQKSAPAWRAITLCHCGLGLGLGIPAPPAPRARGASHESTLRNQIFSPRSEYIFWSRALKVGAINTELLSTRGLVVRSIDLRSSHPRIEERDVFDLEKDAALVGHFDAAVCSSTLLLLLLLQQQQQLCRSCFW